MPDVPELEKVSILDQAAVGIVDGKKILPPYLGTEEVAKCADHTKPSSSPPPPSSPASILENEPDKDEPEPE